MVKRQIMVAWLARFAVGLVFVVNVNCALAYLLHPDRFVAGYEISGVPGQVIVQGFGILFLMWNATYPPVIFQPWTYRTFFWVILIQQAIGLIGETWLRLELPAGHTALAATGLRFILFDGFGLILMGLAFGLLRWVYRPKTSS